MSAELKNKFQYWIMESEGQTPIRLHHVINPGSGEKFSYIHQVSTWAFDKFETNRVFGKGAPFDAPFHFELHTQRAYEYYAANTECHNPFKGLLIEESGTIFDFYKKIGFDYKKKRYATKRAQSHE